MRQPPLLYPCLVSHLAQQGCNRPGSARRLPRLGQQPVSLSTHSMIMSLNPACLDEPLVPRLEFVPLEPAPTGESHGPDGDTQAAASALLDVSRAASNALPSTYTCPACCGVFCGRPAL